MILATGRYLGEGFDDTRLDTLFLTLPIAWRGTLTQYAGRLHRENSTKKEVVIYDYVDFHVPALARMYAKRRAGYKSIGYEIKTPDDGSKPVQLMFEAPHSFFEENPLTWHRISCMDCRFRQISTDNTLY